MEKVLVLDTNVYLHGRFFREIPWADLLQVDEVVIVLPPVVLRELEKHKYGNKPPRIRERAARVVEELFELLEPASASESVALRPGVRLRRLGRKPVLPDGFDPNDQDDELIASCLEVTRSGADVTLVALDRGIMLKAKDSTIHYLRLPKGYEEDRAEPDPVKKELAQLKKVARPELRTKLRFSDHELVDGEPIEISVPALRAATAAELGHWADQRLVQLEADRDDPYDTSHPNWVRPISPPWETEAEELGQLREQAAAVALRREEDARCLRGLLAIQNVGTAPATRVVIASVDCDCDEPLSPDPQEWGREALMQTQTWGNPISVQIPRGFHGRVLTITVRVVASEIPEPVVTRHRLRIREVPAGPFDEKGPFEE